MGAMPPVPLSKGRSYRCFRFIFDFTTLKCQMDGGGVILNEGLEFEKQLKIILKRQKEPKQVGLKHNNFQTF